MHMQLDGAVRPPREANASSFSSSAVSAVIGLKTVIIHPLTSSLPSSSFFFVLHKSPSCFLLLRFPVILSSPSLPPLLSSSLLNPHPQLSPPSNYILFAAQHSVSRLGLNIDGKVNDNSAAAFNVHLHTERRAHKEVTTCLVDVARCAATKQGHAKGRCQNTHADK